MRKPYTVLVAVILALILGGVSVNKMETSLIPELDLPYLAVITTYPGASPEAVEREVTSPLEATLATTPGLDEVFSTSSESYSLVFLQFLEGTDMNTTMLQVRETLDIFESNLPKDAATPMLMMIDMNALPIAVITVDLDGASKAELSAYVRDTVVPSLESVDGVASVSASGMVQEQIHVTINQEKRDALNERIAQLESFTLLLSDDAAASFTQEQLVALMSGDLTVLQDIAAGSSDDEDEEPLITAPMIEQLLSAMNMGFPNGYLHDGGVDYLVRTGDGYTSADDIANQLLISVPEADLVVRVGDVADVEVVDVADKSYTRINGNEAVILTVQKQSEGATATVCHRLNDRMDELQAGDARLHMITLMDQGSYVDMVVDSVSSNLLWGAVLAVFVLLIFLRNWKLTGVIAASIPLSLMVALILMYFSGITLNLLSLSGLALGVGMLVDNSIVVIENIYRKRAEGQDPQMSAIDGAKQVAGAIIASTLTTCAVFLPFAFATGIVKQLFVDLALTICFSLLGSLIVALTFVPAMCAVALKGTPAKEHRHFGAFQEWYAGKLAWCLDHRAVPLVLVTVLFAGAVAYVLTMGTQFMPPIDSPDMASVITFDQDATFDERVEQAEDILATIGEVPGVKTVGVAMGESSGFSLAGLMGGGGNSVSAYIVLDEDREMTSGEIASEIDSRCEAKGYAVRTAASNMDMSMLTGEGVGINVYGHDLDQVQEVAIDLAGKLEGIEGTTDVSDGNDVPAMEIRITVDKDAAIAKGLTVYQVYNAVSQLLSTKSATTSIDASGVSMDVMVNESDYATPTLDDLYALTIDSPQLGEAVPIGDVATIEMVRGYSSISHENQKRYVTVSAQIAGGYNVGKVGKQVERMVDDYQVPEGITLEVTGENESINDAMHDLKLTLILAIILV
ncbi:MAG: efflux RND transporter permease subunit, partial [Coriobacteriales bacterium]|nr:efflux RND transporter permease subunit [Coriobacteriales bacterium]